MTDFKEDFRKFLEEYRARFQKYSLMYGGTLVGVETVWYTLSAFEDFLDGPFEDDVNFEAYHKIAQKYKCGSWVLSAKVKEEFKDKDYGEAAIELLKRLEEVRQLKKELRKK